MNIFQALILGILEGASEYLPVSSTFHLIWASKLLGIAQTDFQKAFEVIIQAGSILAILFLYFHVLRKNRDLLVKLFSSFVPTAIIGLILYKLIKNFFFENTMLQLTVFIGVGVVFILFEQFHKHKIDRTIDTISLSEAVLIGLVQAIAVIPGVSRAGAVMLILMFLGVRRDQAAQYSFLLAVPTLLAASALDIVKTYPLLIASQNLLLLTTGFIAAFVSALLTVKWFLRYLQNHTLSSFGWYRLILATGLFFIR